MFKRNRETFVNGSDSLHSKIKIIKELILIGSKDPSIIAQANICTRSSHVLKCALNYSYNLAVMTLSPDNRQQFRTVRNIIKTRKANCTGYAIIIGSILTALNIPFTLRVASNNPNYFNHIYIVCNGIILDSTIGQDQSGRASFENRKINATFNQEIKSNYKKDFKINMNTVLNGNINGVATAQAMNVVLENYKDVNGKIDFQRATNDIRKILDLGVYGINTIMSLVDKYINPCKRGCDIKYPFNAILRRACKNSCSQSNLNKLNAQELQRLMNYTSAQTSILQNPTVILLGLGVAAYLIMSN